MYNDFLTINKADIKNITLKETMSYENDVLLNRIWYTADAFLIEQVMKKLANLNGNDVSSDRFWAAVPMQGMGIRKIHSGLPAEMVNVLSDLIIADMDGIKLEDTTQDELWKEMNSDDIDFKDVIQQAIIDTLVVGDGAFKISFDSEISEYPIVEFYSGDEVKYDYVGSRIKRIKFYSRYTQEKKSYILEEIYYKGGIEYHLYDKNEKEVSLATVDELAELKDVFFSDKSLMLAVPCMFYKSSKYKGRGKSIYDNKTELFDAFDEAISAWTDAERDNRAKNYIPDDMFPRNPETGETLEPNPFMFRFIRVNGSLDLGKDGVNTQQSTIDYQAHQANIISKRDQCIEGIISGATLGFNVAADSSGESQKEKKDMTLITRNHITTRLEKVIRKLVAAIIRAYYQSIGGNAGDVNVEFTFGEYSKMSFDDKIKTLSAARPGEAIMSKEAMIDELWGDSKDEDWKKEELERLNEESTIVEETPFPVDGDFLSSEDENITE